MGNLQGFDANQYEAQSFDVLPAGEYDVVIVASSVEQTKSGTGKYLKLELQVINGQFKKRKLFDNLNLWNQSQQAQTIARGQMSAICRAIGNLTPKDSSELHMKKIRCKVKIEKSEEYGDSNKIVGYRLVRPARQRATATAAAGRARRGRRRWSIRRTRASGRRLNRLRKACSDFQAASFDVG